MFVFMLLYKLNLIFILVYFLFTILNFFFYFLFFNFSLVVVFKKKLAYNLFDFNKQKCFTSFSSSELKEPCVTVIYLSAGDMHAWPF